MPARSLLELSLDGAVDLLLGSDLDYEVVEPRMLQLMLEHVKLELTASRRKKALTTHFGTTLNAKIIQGTVRITTAPAHDHRDCDASSCQDGRCVKRMLRSKWRIMEDDASDLIPLVTSPPITWNHHEIYAASPETAFQICRHRRPHTDFDCACMSETGQPLAMRITSELLCYRVAATFGMPCSTSRPRHWHPVDCLWERHLVFRGDGSLLLLRDWKGSASAEFHGTVEASESALALLDYLSGTECPKGFSDVVVGAQMGIGADLDGTG